ncbi:MAG: DoxX family protein [Gemmatimonadota bacterium]|nr:DoxX family protein [Gemmatimonadota bacterium]
MTSISLRDTDTIFGRTRGWGASGRATRGNDRVSSKRIRAALWTVQGLLAALFLFAGAMKFIMPIEVMTKQIPFPAWFLYFIGVAEVLGAIGLVLPSLLRIRTGLTPLAASGLVIIMIGATVLTAAVNGVAPAVMPFVVGLLSFFVAYGRWRLAPIS